MKMRLLRVALPAQRAKSATGCTMVTANEEKMSKSLGNFFTIREVTKLYHPLALRHFLLGTHYRSAVNYSIAQIEISSAAVFYMYQTLHDCQDALSLYREGGEELTLPNGKTAHITPAAQEYVSKLRNEFESKMADDLHTPTLLKATLDEGFKLMNSSLNLLRKKQQKQKQLSTLQFLVELELEVKSVLNVLGLLSSSTYSEVLEQLKGKALRRAHMTEEDILLLTSYRGKSLSKEKQKFLSR